MKKTQGRAVSYVPDNAFQPAGGIICKFVLIRVLGQDYLVYGRVSEFPYHANIVERFCNDNEIASFWAHKPDLVEVMHDGVEINGGGWLRLDRHAGRVELYGHSTGYGRFDLEIANRIVSQDDIFPAFTVVIN